MLSYLIGVPHFVALSNCHCHRTMVVRLSGSNGSSAKLEHTAAMAEQRGNLGAKVKAIYEISRLIRLEQRLNQQASDDYGDSLYRQHPDLIGEQAAARFAKRANAEPEKKQH
jgi:hypothetical protein